MPFSKLNNTEACKFDNAATKKQKLAASTPSTSSHGIYHTAEAKSTTTTFMEWSFHPTDTNNVLMQHGNDAFIASTIANNSWPIAFFDYNFVFEDAQQQQIQQEDEKEKEQQKQQQQQEEGVLLPQGWRLAGRKRSIFELDTNIHTLSELYSTLVDLRNQLPNPIADQVEQPFKKRPSLLSAQSSIEDAMSWISRTGSSYLSFSRTSSSFISNATNNMSTLTEQDEEKEIKGQWQQDTNAYDRLRWTYPDFIFELLVQIYLDCICFTRVQPRRLLELHRQGNKLDKAYACAIYAYASLHALLCHPERFGIYSFMNQLAVDAYQIAFDLIEFDSMESVTCETLVIMYQYLMTVGQDGEARNLFCLAQRQMELLLSTLSQNPQQQEQQQDMHRLYVWMAELDWSFSLTQFTAPLIEHDGQLKASLDQIKPIITNYKDDQLYVKATKFRIKGLYILLNNNSSHRHKEQPSTTSSLPHQRLNKWRTKYLETFMYKRHDSCDDNDGNESALYTLEDKLALRLHALYFAGMLELHQQHMLKGFESDQLWESNRDQLSDYFSSSHHPVSSTFEISHNGQTQVEKGLYRSMNAAYGFIQVVRLLLDEMDRCILPQVIDTLSAACTVLYFGNKVVFANKEMIQKSQEALAFVVHAFLSSTTFAMMECPRIDRFVKKWGSLINNK